MAATASAQPPARTNQPATGVPFVVRSSAFATNESIPGEYTCYGDGKRPPLSWSQVPAGTKSIAILVDDPDAPKGTFTHWIVTNVPPTVTSLPADAPLPKGASEGKNSMGKRGYIAPCPPSGMHHYHYFVYALDTRIAPAATRADLLSAIEGHVLASGQLVGMYERAGGGARMR
jgi:Raf kinase inhibitor-like YbhB/YbcL family protein